MISGNVKFDNAQHRGPRADAPRDPRVRPGSRATRRCVVAGSTHPGEEADVVAAFQEVQRRIGAAVLILAPRHLERVPLVRALLDGVGLETLRWTERSPAKAAPCMLVDTIGELGGLYAAADVAFVGGSLQPDRGPQPARARQIWYSNDRRTAPRVGPEPRTSFEQSGALTVVRDRDDLARELRACFSDRVGAAARRQDSAGDIAANQGAARRCAEVLAAARQWIADTDARAMTERALLHVRIRFDGPSRQGRRPDLGRGPGRDARAGHRRAAWRARRSSRPTCASSPARSRRRRTSTS